MKIKSIPRFNSHQSRMNIMGNTFCISVYQSARACAGLILTDEYTQQKGVTIAAILLFGQDSTIMSILPQHKTDAIFRVFNTDRYDDRDVVITNLIESYDRLLDFGQKHLNDTFHLDGIQSVSARDHILREIISNLLSHRDFSSGYIAKLIIENCKYAKLKMDNRRYNHKSYWK